MYSLFHSEARSMRRYSSGVSRGFGLVVITDKSRAFLLRQQQLEVIRRELPQDAVLLADDGVGELALALLQLQDFLLDRVARDEAVREHVARLPDAVGPVDRLRFDRGVPPRVEE